MLWRFSLYGFLKNQRYFEPFLVLLLLDKGLNFTLIGLLIGVRELAVALMEIPSGAAADVWGRKRCMILSFVAYVFSFVVFGLAEHVGLLFAAMLLFAVGESFRTGTHKAIIFSWLRHVGRTDERVRVYGFTRSWSKLGSAVSVILATAFVFLTNNYDGIVFLSILPYLVGIANFLAYPAEVDGERTASGAACGVSQQLRSTLGRCVSERGLRGLVWESMSFEGVFHATKDYLQPILQAAAAIYFSSLAVNADLSELQRTALLVGLVYLALYFLAAISSRYAHRFADRMGGEDRAAQRLWEASAVVSLGLLTAGLLNIYIALTAGFILLHVMQNLWRPVLVSRLDEEDCEADGATVLSIESQSRRLATMILAPVLGAAIDLVTRTGFGGCFWPVGALGAVTSLAVLLLRAHRTHHGKCS